MEDISSLVEKVRRLAKANEETLIGKPALMEVLDNIQNGVQSCTKGSTKGCTMGCVGS